LKNSEKGGETRWSKDGYIILGDTITEKAGTKSSTSAASTITLKATLSGSKISSMFSTLPTKPLPAHRPPLRKTR